MACCKKGAKTNKKASENTKYLYAVFQLLKKRESITLSHGKNHFSDTELRMLAEILSAKYEGRRVISTQLAKLLGVTRSAVSQIVNRLEENGVVKRVADDVDRKIAYIEVTEETMAYYEADLNTCLEFTGKVVERFGAEKFETMCRLFGEFVDAIEEEKRHWNTKENGR